MANYRARTTGEALGYGSGERLLIIHADDFGLCHSVNQAVGELLDDGTVSGASIMMPCSWAKEAADWCAARKEVDVGVHLTFTSEWEPYRWGPVSHTEAAPSLLDPQNYFPRDCRTFELQADPAQVKAEARKQIEMALQLGLQPTHADNHMGSLYGLETGRHFLPVVFELCAEYGLPFRLPRFVTGDQGQAAPPELAEQARQLAAYAERMGVVILDYLVTLPFRKQEEETYESFRQSMKQLLAGIKPGVTELYIHPSYVTEELLAFHGSPEKRGWEKQIFREPDIRQTLVDEGIRVIGWRELQQLQRAGKA
ncbi:polysaccharide deacetylase family protein [Paenibacillus protaetiae]|uniref:ChbG/HpnK family deacetylase n=1 Tax=Paenibacillus protaetiae TaxID=2509456 RepID=A0A4P6EU53_9BACL|nr:polysaccharide deacetylase family protein [Paenibacillus protaetiae]QAY66005.1 ChbG/HpnK family deacetylase [Paenibacillus protaetiae]